MNLDANWTFEDIHDDCSAKIVNEVGVPVMLSQLFMGKDTKVVPALAVFKEAALEASVAKAAEEMCVGNKVGSGEVLTLRKENQKQQMKRRDRQRRSRLCPSRWRGRGDGLGRSLARSERGEHSSASFRGFLAFRAALLLMGMSRQLIPPQRLGSGASAAVERR